MRPGEMECRSRLGDRVRWVPERIERDEINVDPVGIVIATKRHYPRSPDLALDLILVLFDEHISLGAGGGGFIQQWFPPEQIEDEIREPSTTEGKDILISENSYVLRSELIELSTTEGERETLWGLLHDLATDIQAHPDDDAKCGADLEKHTDRVLCLLAQRQEQGEREGWTREVKYFRSFLCACGYMGREYDSGLLICTKCGFGRHPDSLEPAGGEDE